jgi:hypothetical protein
MKELDYNGMSNADFIEGPSRHSKRMTDMGEWIESHSVPLIVTSLIICAILLMSLLIYLTPEIDKTITAGCTITSGSILTKCKHT